MLTAEQIMARHYRPEDHPYRRYEDKIAAALNQEHTILDAGCGRTAPVPSNYIGKARKLIGVDLEDFTSSSGDIEYVQGDISSIKVPDASVDIVISRAVLEHVLDPEAVFAEVHRILKPGGSFIFLAPNLWDYVSVISFLVPNRFHPYIVNKTEGRTVEDVFLSITEQTPTGPYRGCVDDPGCPSMSSSGRASTLRASCSAQRCSGWPWCTRS